MGGAMATKRKRGAKWEYCVKRKGLLPRPLYLSFDTEAEGDDYTARLERLLDTGHVPPEFLTQPREYESITHVIRAYLLESHVAESDADLLGVLNQRIGKTRLTAINDDWAHSWITGLKRADRLSPGTIRHYVGALARCLDWGRRRGVPELVVNPLRNLPRGYASYSPADGPAVEDVSRDRRLTADEEVAIRRVLAGEYVIDKQRPLTLEHRGALLCLFDLALETAMRLSEMYTLTVDQIDLNKRTVFLEKTKNGDKRQVPLSTVAMAALGDYLDTADLSSGYVFPWYRGADRKRVTSLLSRQFGRIFRTAGCDDLHFHDLRHQAICQMFLRTDLSPLEIAIISGHHDLRMLKRYANLRGSELAGRLW